MLNRYTMTLIGLETATLDDLTLKALKRIKEQKRVYYKYPISEISEDWLQDIKVVSVPEQIQPAGIGAIAPQQIVDYLLNELNRMGRVIYLSVGDPNLQSVECKLLQEKLLEEDIELQLIYGRGYLDRISTRLDLQEDDPLLILEAESLLTHYYPPFSPTSHVVLKHWKMQYAEKIRDVLLQQYPENHPIQILALEDSVEHNKSIISLKQLSDSSSIEGDLYLYISPLENDSSFEDFQDVIAHLRAPDGCPWDRKQTHQSLKTSLLEETYEALAALDEENLTDMCEEFGDLLLQIVLHAQIASEAGNFKMIEIMQGINRKLVRRHPHVFADASVKGVDGVLKKWEEIKAEERKENGTADKKGILDGVPQVFPALLQAQEYQKRAGRVGFDWENIEGVWEKVFEELHEIKTAGNEQERFDELGDVLFAVVNLARWLEIDAESSLRITNQRFKSRFKYIEEAVKQRELVMDTLTLKELDVFWEEAKSIEKKNGSSG